MTSHTYDFARRDLARLIGGPLLVVVVFAAIIHLIAALGLLPAPRPTLDVDRTILVHQIEAARANPDTEILLVGDSSCLMSVEARRLSELLGCRVLNLGTLSYLDLTAYATLIREHQKANPPNLRGVVLLMHPEALRRPAPEDYHMRLFNQLLRGQDTRGNSGFREALAQTSGLEKLRTRILARCLPTPLPGAYGRFYGFSDDLDRWLTQQHGSAVDPDPQPFQGDADYRLAPQLEAASKTLRTALPRGTGLWVGITPAPAGFVRKGFAEQRDQMLTQWGHWLQTDMLLTNLPAVLPDDQFAKTTHLNSRGARAYTELLAQALKTNLK